MRSAACLSAIVWLIASPVFAKPISADSASAQIEMHASFSGIDLLIFGARNEPGDIIIAVRGPGKHITVRRKERIAGMWMTLRRAKLRDLPQFFALAATRDPARIASPALLASLELSPESFTRARLSRSDDPAFADAVLRLKRKAHLYSETVVPITFFGETLFKTRIHFPDTLPQGVYLAEIYLFAGGRLVALQTIPIEAVKTGFEARLFALSETDGLAYGLLCITVALGFGWLAYRIFRRR